MAGIVCHGGSCPIINAAIIVDPGISNKIPMLTIVADKDLKVMLNNVWPRICAKSVKRNILIQACLSNPFIFVCNDNAIISNVKAAAKYAINVY